MREVAGVLLRQNGRYVLQHRDDNPKIAESGKYALWGGALEPQDAGPAEAASRELAEETGVKVLSKDLIHLKTLIVPSLHPASKGSPVKVHIFGFEVLKDIVIECFEGQGIKRITTKEAREDTNVSRFVAEAIELYEQAG